MSNNPSFTINTKQYSFAIQLQNSVNTATGLLDFRGEYNASVNTFPSSGGSGAAGNILKGDTWVVSGAGTLGGIAVSAGDMLFAKIDAPAQVLGNWAVVQANLTTTDTLPEGATNLYFTAARAIASVLTGLSVSDAVASATDTVLAAIGKLQGQLNNSPKFIKAITADLHIGPSSVAETDCFTQINIIGGTLGTQNAIRVRILFDVWNFTGSNQTITFIFYHGGSSRLSVTTASIASSGSWRSHSIEFVLKGNQATNKNLVRSQISLSNGTSGGVPNNATTQTRTDYTLDNTADQTMKVTATQSASNSALETYIAEVFIERINAL